MTRKQSRDPLERLDTPPAATRALLHYLPALAGLRVIEPCAGANAITHVLTAAGCEVAAFDIEPRADGVLAVDTTTPGFFEQIATKHDPKRIALVTNPPFSRAAHYSRVGQMFDLCVLLVRLSWLESTRDREDLPDPDALIILPRLKFTGPGAIDPDTGKPYTGGDSVTVCWAIWAPGSRWPSRPIVRVSRKELHEIGAETHAPGLTVGAA
jgi:hypothetical protein